MTLLVLTVAVGLVLLIACVNVANLRLARTAARQRELAVRLALGAGRGRLIRQALTESMLLALIGGVAGIAIALGGIQLLRNLAASLPRRDLGPGIGLPRLGEITVDGSVLVFTLAASVLTGVIFGVIPAIWQARARPPDALRQGTRRPQGWLRGVPAADPGQPALRAVEDDAGDPRLPSAASGPPVQHDGAARPADFYRLLLAVPLRTHTLRTHILTFDTKAATLLLIFRIELR